MNIFGREIVDVLEKKAVLEWYRFPIYNSGVISSAVVVWRYDLNQTDELKIDKINLAIKSALAKRLIKWDLMYTGKNWVLAPAIVLELEKSGKFKNEYDVMSYICGKDALFSEKAHTDLT